MRPRTALAGLLLTAAIIGGVGLFGGRGTILGSLLGAVILAELTSGLVMIIPMTGTTPGAAIPLPTVADLTWELFRDTVMAHGAMTAAVYSTSPSVLDGMRTASLDAGVALSENLTGGVFVNQSAAFSDFHGTGANPAATASFTDTAYVANRFRVVQSRRHV